MFHRKNFSMNYDVEIISGAGDSGSTGSANAEIIGKT